MSKIKDVLKQLYIQECYTYIKEVLSRSDFNYAIIKGEALSRQAYGKTGQRYSSDIDVLVPRTSRRKRLRALSPHCPKSSIPM